MSAKSLENLLKINKDGGLGAVIEKARALGELTETLSRALPGDLADGVVAVNVRDERRLVVLARSSAWASRLRFEQDAVLEAAKTAGINVDGVSVRVARVDYNNPG